MGKFKIKVEHWQIIAALMVVYDIVVFAGSYFLGLFLRFDLKWNAIPEFYMTPYVKFIPLYCVISVMIFGFFKLYNFIWRFAGFSDMVRIVCANLVTWVIHIAATLLFYQRMPISYYVIGAGFQVLLTFAIRFSYRFYLARVEKLVKGVKVENVINVMLIGAGEAGQLILRDLQKNDPKRKVVCIIDDNPNKWNRYIFGVKVIGGRDIIIEAAKEYNVQEIFLAIPSLTLKQQADILNICKETDCELKNLPGMMQLVNNQVTIKLMKDVAVEDLLGRDQIKVDMQEIFDFISGKVVLVTGGGGSIGSELCRQIASHNVKQLIIFDIYENTTYELQRELVEKYPQLDLKVLIGSVRDSDRISSVFEKYRPQIVYHAAAHKHVPLMEDSPCEAIKNNVLGTYNTAFAAMKYGAERFVMISTDKAVNPTNIMGASKRLCEMVIQTFDWCIKNGKEELLPKLCGTESEDTFTGHGTTEYVAVRFGNVLGSNGSVIPLFKKQIENHGPVTVTHPDIIRYFMTIPEAVSLVLQAGTYANGGEIFVLNMGEPVKIDTLARNLIRLSGFRPDEDIKIVYTGLRPGEKLYEEKLMAEEGLENTPNELIHIGHPVKFDHQEFLLQLRELIEMADSNSDEIISLVEKIVTTYKPAGREPAVETKKD